MSEKQLEIVQITDDEYYLETKKRLSRSVINRCLNMQSIMIFGTLNVNFYFSVLMSLAFNFWCVRVQRLYLNSFKQMHHINGSLIASNYLI